MSGFRRYVTGDAMVEGACLGRIEGGGGGAGDITVKDNGYAAQPRLGNGAGERRQFTPADVAQDIAGMLVVRELECPQPMHDPLMALVDRSVEACNQLGEIMDEFDSLVEHGFRGPESEKVLLMIDDLSKIETDTDEKGMYFTKQLFTHEQELNPVSVILWLRLGRLIGDLANFAERTGNKHRLLIAR